jgi:hypothetical protein
VCALAFEMPKKAKWGVGTRAKGKKSAALNLWKGPAAGKKDDNKSIIKGNLMSYVKGNNILRVNFVLDMF